MLHGRCSCGAVSFAIGSLPRDVHYCHCTMCRRATGSAFSVLAWCDSTQVSWFGAPATESRSSGRAVRGFCGACGSPLFQKYDDSAEIALYVGAFDQPQAFVPTHHCGSESRLIWVDIASGLPSEECERKSLIRTLTEDLLPRKFTKPAADTTA